MLYTSFLCLGLVLSLFTCKPDICLADANNQTLIHFLTLIHDFWYLIKSECACSQYKVRPVLGMFALDYSVLMILFGIFRDRISMCSYGGGGSSMLIYLFYLFI